MTPRLVLVLFAGLSILSCDSREAAEEGSRASRSATAVASVDGSALEVADLASEAAGARRDPKRQLEAAIARKLASAEARRRNLDERPAVAAQLDAIRRDAARREEKVLRDALFASLRAAAAVTDEELRAHYEKTKRRFAERRWRLLRQRFASEAEARAADAQLEADGRLGAANSEAIGPATAAEVAAATNPEVLRLQRPGQPRHRRARRWLRTRRVGRDPSRRAEAA